MVNAAGLQGASLLLAQAAGRLAGQPASSMPSIPNQAQHGLAQVPDSPLDGGDEPMQLVPLSVERRVVPAGPKTRTHNFSIDLTFRSRGQHLLEVQRRVALLTVMSPERRP